MDWDDQSSVSSEDSIEYEAPSSHGRAGVAAELMARMGYVKGMGLGANNQGMLEPIEQQKRPKLSGLGSIPVIEQAEELAQPSVSRAELLTAQIASMESLLELLSSPASLDVDDFVEVYGDSPFWIDDKLWEVVEILVLKELRNRPLDKPDLILLHRSLPKARYISFLKKVWLPEAGSSLDLDQTLDQISSFGQLLPSVLLGELSEKWATNSLIINALLSNRTRLTKSLYLLSDFSSLLLANCSDLERLSPVFSLIKPELTIAYFVSLLRSKSLYEQLHLLEQFAPLLNDGLPQLASQCVLPAWFKELRQHLESRTFTPSWWSTYKTRIMSLKLENNDWLLSSLNYINSYLDTGSTNTIEHPPTLQDVLEQYCLTNGFRVQTNSNNTGTVGSSNKVLKYQIKDEVFHLVLTHELVPISILSLANYLL